MCDFVSKNKELFQELDKYINSVENKDDALISTLHYGQKLFGYLPKDVQLYIGEKLDVSPNKIENIINFYHYFTTEPKGKYKINVCLGSACSKNESSKIIYEFERLLNIKSGETTDDMKFSLNSSRCMGVCRKTPIVTINGRIYESVAIEDIPSILETCE